MSKDNQANYIPANIPSDKEDVNWIQANPVGYTFLEDEHDDRIIIKGQDEHGEITECTITATYNESSVKLFLAFKITGNDMPRYFDAFYKWEGRDELAEAIYYNEKANSIKFWAIQSHMSPLFPVAVWRRAKGFFLRVVYTSYLHSLSVQAKKLRAQEGEGDLFSENNEKNE